MIWHQVTNWFLPSSLPDGICTGVVVTIRKLLEQSDCAVRVLEELPDQLPLTCTHVSVEQCQVCALQRHHSPPSQMWRGLSLCHSTVIWGDSLGYF